ncbi:hypothetical protein QN362_03700 [Actimicrobium sp. CCC2.4]|uniref:hypothetical protein n=1 Tax=Actimicrobium sp. CCC2.4 TaxID=3048606 RepID=UPI002AC8BC4D|nr:hypothetical protein [Actimicrobium sp. CCC2.4]MEB0134431.1 hypothetical protein [Actimicrobium sp. CCC2.4]WPX33067.1 hypothetical protein RHM62_04265 [Actimicrobium sp. CCC2.4]
MKSFLLAQMSIRNQTQDQRILAPVQHVAERNPNRPGMPVLALAASAPVEPRSQGQSNQLRFMHLYASDDLPGPATHRRKPFSVNIKKPVLPTPRRRSETRRRSATDPNSLIEFDHEPKVANKNQMEDSVTGSISPYVTVPIGDPLPLSRASATLSRQDFLRRNPAGTLR